MKLTSDLSLYHNIKHQETKDSEVILKKYKRHIDYESKFYN